MTMMLRVLLLFFFLQPFMQAQQDTPLDRYRDALTLYRNAEYRQAISLFQELIDEGFVNFDLYYNMGNAAYKNGELGVSVLSYERALTLDPGNEDIVHNLNVVRARLRDRVEPMPLLFFVKWWNDVKDAHRPAVFFAWSAASFCLLSVSAFFFFGYRRVVLRRVALIAGILLLIFFGASLALTLLRTGELEAHRTAVIMPSAVTVRSTPDATGVEIFVIHEGLKVEILGSRNDSYRIRLEDGKNGWVDKGVLVRI